VPAPTSGTPARPTRVEDPSPGPVLTTGDATVGARADLAIVGPTASGKTALACALNGLVPGLELVSVDAMAVYRHLDIGTAKPSPAERWAARWHMLDLVDPAEEFSVAEFQTAARRALVSIAARGNRAVLVGGTGLYHRALIDDLAIPGRYPETAQMLEACADRPGGLALLYRRLSLLDPVAAARIEPANRRRVVRALEVTMGAGRRFSSYGPGLRSYGESGVPIVALALPLEEIYRRVESRFREQLGRGLLEEVRRLAAHPAGLSRTARQALGYRELLSHVEDGVPLEEACALAVRRLRRFSRRQISWFSRDPRVTWFDAERPDLAEAVAGVLGREGTGGSRGTMLA
jgi:tRNA dimethylallyltransferase